MTLLVSLVGALVSVAFWPHHVPILGMIIGGTIGYGLAAVTISD